MSSVVTLIVGALVGAAVSVGLQLLVDRRNAEKRARSQSGQYDRLDLSGTWVAIWQTSVRGNDNINSETVVAAQHRNEVFLHNEAVSTENPDGGYLWKGQLTVFDNTHLCGYYIANQPNVISKGSFYFVLHNSGNLMEGGWTGCSYDSHLVSGCAVLARDKERAWQAMNVLRKEYRASRVRRKI